MTTLMSAMLAIMKGAVDLAEAQLQIANMACTHTIIAILLQHAGRFPQIEGVSSDHLRETHLHSRL